MCHRVCLVLALHTILSKEQPLSLINHGVHAAKLQLCTVVENYTTKSDCDDEEDRLISEIRSVV